MKQIIAYVRADMVDNLARAVHHEHFRHVSVFAVCDLEAPAKDSRSGLNPHIGRYSQMIKMEYVCAGEEVEEVVALVRAACYTGNRGDGLIVVTDVCDCVSVRTGKRGPEALGPPAAEH